MAKKGTVVDGQLLFLVALLGALCVAAYLRGGTELLREGLGDGGSMLLRFGLVITVSFFAAGLAQVLVPSGLVEGSIGPGSGLRGIVIAAGAGMITPAGPFVSMPIAAAMLRTGAGLGPVVAFLTGWSLLAVHRLIAWEIPILGARFALLRYAISFALPILAGWIALQASKAVGDGP